MFATEIPTQLFAIDSDVIVGAIVFVVWILSWLFKLVANQNQKTPPVVARPRTPVRPRDEKLQEEIDIFIQDAGAKKPVRKPAAAAAQQAASAPSRGKPPEKRSAQAGEPRPVTAKPSRRPRPGEQLAKRHATGNENLGSGVKQHLRDYMAEKVSKEVAVYLQPKVEQQVTEYLGDTSAQTTQGPARPAAGAGVSELLRKPGNLRQAIVLNLILSPPPALARRDAR